MLYAPAMHGLACHEAEIDQQPESVPSEEELQIHVLCFIFFFQEEAAAFGPKVGAYLAFVVKHFKRAVDRDADFGQVEEDVLFRIPHAR